MQIRRLTKGDAQMYWATRNQGLAEFPDAFTSSHAEGLATPADQLARRFGGNGSDDFVLGAFDDNGSLAGCAGFQRETRTKNRHKGTVIGMYVSAVYRGRGIGKLLLVALIEETRKLPHLEQLNLTVTHSNTGARMLYLNMGFVSFGLEKKALKIGDKYYDKEHMALSLL